MQHWQLVSCLLYTLSTCIIACPTNPAQPINQLTDW
jgi:hypothetical protein